MHPIHPTSRSRATPRVVVRAFALLAGFALAGCGPSEEELALRRQVRELRGEVHDAKQRADDLRVRVQTIRARNKVLIGLVLGLTAEPDQVPRSADPQATAMGKAQQALSELDRDLDVLASSLKKSRQDFQQLRTERSRLRSNLDEAMRTIEDAKKREQRAQQRLQTFRDMLLRLRAMIEEAKLDVHVVRNQMVVQLPEALLFDTGKAVVKTEGKELLDNLALVLQAVEGREFQVAGHTDSVPIHTWRYRSNWDLSAARAVNVTQYLIERGVARERLSAAAYADTRPATATAHDEERAQDRRIEIVLLPNLDELPDLSVLDGLTHADKTVQPAPEPAPEPAAEPGPEPATEPGPEPATEPEPVPPTESP